MVYRLVGLNLRPPDGARKMGLDFQHGVCMGRRWCYRVYAHGSYGYTRDIWIRWDMGALQNSSYLTYLQIREYAFAMLPRSFC